MRKYEIMYILKANLEEADRTAEMEKLSKILTDNGAKVSKVSDALGMRDLAYPIKGETKGFYVVMDVEMDDAANNEFQRLIRINPNVLRHLVTKSNK